MNISESAKRLASHAAHQITCLTGISRHDILVVLGSGYSSVIEYWNHPLQLLSMDQLIGFISPDVPGHHSQVISCTLGRHRVLVFCGRIHLYQGYSPTQIVHPIRTAIAAGVHTIILTNAAGGICPNFQVGQLVIIRDHINLSGRSPLIGPHFIDLHEAYNRQLRDIACQVDSSLQQGVYALMPGPHYETPAEIRMLGLLGADLVGMSTVLETIAARAAGANVLGISLVTNNAAGITTDITSHDEVLKTGYDATYRVSQLIKDIIQCL